jgi:hypothetical protein
MPQGAPPPATPAPPATQQPGRDLGDLIRDQINQAVTGALGPARAAVQAEIQQMTSQRDALRAALDATTDRSSRRDLQRQIDRLDNRIDEARDGLQKIDQQLANRNVRTPGIPEIAQPPHFPTTPPLDNFNPAPMVISIMAILFIGFPLALTMARLIWRRATHATPPALNLETARRFDRLEQSVDAIAIEVERISENQRYLTRLLAEPKPGAKIGG